MIYKDACWRSACILTIVLQAASGFSQQMFVSSRNSHEVKLYDLNTGAFIENFVTAGSGGLSFPQEVLWHPDDFLLVTGRGNTAIKKYDGITGAYLGNFTSGYALDNPTKTTIWKDSLLYVSQWGAVQNKVVRFNFKTGAFVDEFTNAGVPTGDSHAWDAAGNLYVPQWGNGVNGKVLKFDTAGTLIGTFISTSLLDGPVNIWFGANGNLFVVDWTKGDLLEFNGTTGAFISTIINTTSQLEGFAFDSQGFLYLGDWTENLIHRYDFATNTLTPFIQSGGLAAPNSILIREQVSGISEAAKTEFQLNLSPNPASESARIRYFLEKNADVRLEVLNILGQNVATVFSGKQAAGEHEIFWDGMISNGLSTQAGVYFVCLSIGNEQKTAKLVWR